MLLVGLLTLIACTKGSVGNDNGQKNVILKILNEDGSIFKDKIALKNALIDRIAKEGYTGKLYLDKECTKELTASSDVKNGDSVYVRWTVNQYTLTFVFGNGAEDLVLKQDFGTDIEKPADPEKVGYKFKDWGEAVPETMPARNLTFTAQWTVNQYKVTFVLNNGEKDFEVMQDFGTAITVPTPKKVGYTFVGWDKEIPAEMPAEALTFTAQWTINQYTLTFKNGNEVIKTEKVDYGTAITAPTLSDTVENTFVGWGDVPETMPAEDLTFTAQWKKRAYKLTFLSFDGSELYPADVEWGNDISDYFDKAYTEASKRLGDFYDIKGWYDKSDESKTIIEDYFLEMPKADFTLQMIAGLNASSVIANPTITNPKEVTYSENDDIKFDVNFTKIEGITYSYVWTIEKGNNNPYKEFEASENSELWIKGLVVGTYYGSVTITASQKNCDSVEKTINGTVALNVLKANLGIDVSCVPFKYGDTEAQIVVTGTKEGDKVQYKVDNKEYADEVELSTLGAGEHTYSVKVTRNENYNVYDSGARTMTIEKASVTVVVTPEPDNATLTYGDPLPSLVATINGETYKIESGKYTLQLKDGMQAITGSVANNVGTYNINVDVKKSGLSKNYPNYEITVETKGTIKINEADLSVTIGKINPLTYGDDVPEISYTFSELKLSDKESDFAVSVVTTYKKKADADDYTLTATVSGDKTKFYNITVNTVEFKVNKKSATITVNKVDEIVYGSEEPALSATANDVLAGDSLVYTLKTDYTVGAKPGKDYNVYVVFDENAEENKNYAINATGTTFTVGKKPLDIKLDSSVSVGNVAKTYTVEVGNLALVIGELATGDVIEGNVSITKSEGGIFENDNDFQKNIVIKNAAGEDVTTACYKITYKLKVVFVEYTFEINAAAKTVMYNGAPQNVDLVTTTNTNYAITYGMAENECNAKSLSELNCINAGTYTIYFKVVDTTNGVEEKGRVTLTISPVEVTITVNDVTITYKEKIPAFSCTVTEFVNGETHSVEADYTVKTLSGEEINIGAGTDTDAGEYKIFVSGRIASDNYTVTTVKPGKLTINKKSATVEWNIAESYVYSPAGQTLPTAKYDGKEAMLKLTKDGEVVNEFKNAGTYTITVADDKNYTLSGETTQTIVIKKATYTSVTPHEELSGTYDPTKTLGSYTLKEGFAWVNPDEVPVCTKTKYAVKYNMDPNNYEDFENETTTVTLTLDKAKVALKVNVLEFVFDNTAHKVGTTVTYKGNEIPQGQYELKYDGKNSVTYNNAGTFRTLVTMTAENYDLPKDTYLYVKVKGVKIGSTYYTIEDALFYSKSGETIEFIDAVKEVPFASLDVRQSFYEDDAYRTLKPGVTLKLASDQDKSLTIGKPTYSAKGEGTTRYIDNDNTKIKYKLIINNATEFIVHGNILVQGLLGYCSNASYQGHTSGNHSQIINDGTISLNNGAILDLRGYIKGTGTVEARSGAKVYSPFVIRDFRGGTSTFATYKAGVSPFNVYEMPNIQCQVKYLFGATHMAYLNLYAGEQHNVTTNNIIASKSAMIILKDNSAGVIKTYDRDNEKTTLTIFGNLDLGDLSLDVEIGGIPFTVRMSKVRYPIPWNYTVNIGNGSATAITISYDYKIMTGATVNVNKNATVKITTGTVMVYESFKDVPFGGWVYPDKDPAKLYVEGVLDVTGAYIISSASHGGISGKIHGINGGKVIIAKKATLSHTAKEGHGTGLTTFEEAASISLKAELVNANNSTIPVAKNKNKTYTYNGTIWQ